MAKPSTVRVSNLSEMTTEEQVHALFGEAGIVNSVQIVTNNEGRSIGTAFVELDSQNEADTAIHMLNGKQYDSRTLAVTQA